MPFLAAGGAIRAVALTLALIMTMTAHPKRSAAQSGDQPDTNENASSSTISYGADYFSVINPITALEMVERLPGFTLAGGSSVRGFGGAAGNVLIDGERPSAKGQSLTDILGQIPAETVSRIDLIRGRAPGIDMRGQPVVANIIRVPSQISGFAELELRLDEEGHVTPNGEISVTGRYKTVDYTLGIERFVFRDLDDQPERLIAADGVLLERRPETADNIPHQWTLTGNIRTEIGPWTVRSNNELFLSRFVFRERSPAFDARTGDFLRQNDTSLTNKTRRIELGGDVERAFTELFSLKIIALQSLRDFKSDQMFRTRLPGRSETITLQDIIEDSGESILRAVGTFTPEREWTIEAGAEGAYNVLDSTVSLAIDTGNGPRRQDLPISDTKVEEFRGEPFANASWRPEDNLTVEGGLTVEASSLQQSGDAEESRSFVFFKPAFNLAYDVTDTDQLRLAVRRDVAQLDFSDFVSSATLNEQTTDFGNPELVPQRDWIARIEWERRFTDSDSITVLFERRWLEQVQALVPVAGQFDAPGNIGDGSLWRTRLSWEFSLDELNLQNAVFEGWYEFAKSSVRDPVTGKQHQLELFNPDQPFQEHRIRLEFRQDFPESQWAWGWDYFFGTPFEEFRIDERRRIDLGGIDLDLFVETTRYLGLKLRLEAGINEARNRRERFLFDGPRSDGILRAIEIRDRAREKQLLFSARKAF